MRRLSVAVVAMVGMFAMGGGSAVAQPSSASAVPCLGLQCPDQPSADAAGSAGAIAPAISLKGAPQVKAGYYRFPDPDLRASTVVGWVAPPGTISSAPPEVQALSVVRPLAASGTLDRHTVVLLGDGNVAVAPLATDELAAATDQGAGRAAADGPVELAAAPAAVAEGDEYGCIGSYFCVYEHIQWRGWMQQIHPISDQGWWTYLAYELRDAVSSVRNRRDRDSWLAEHWDGSGWRQCYDSHNAWGSLGYSISDEGSSIYNSPGDGSC